MYERHLRVSFGPDGVQRQVRDDKQRRDQLRCLRARLPRGSGMYERHLRVSFGPDGVQREVRKHEYRRSELWLVWQGVRDRASLSEWYLRSVDLSRWAGTL